MKTKSKNVIKTTKIVVLLSSIFILLTLNPVSGQLKVATNGKIGVGTTSPIYGSMQIGADGTNTGLSFYQSSNSGSVFSIYRKGDYGYLTRAGYDTRGLRFSPSGKMYLYTSETANYSSTFISVSNNDLGLHYVVMPSSTGVFSFYVQGNGQVFHTGLHTISDSTEKKEISDIDNSLSKVLKLRGVTYKFKEHKNSVDEKLAGSTEAETEIIYNEYKNISPSVANALAKEKDRKEMGLIAQEVEEIVPEVVRTTYDGRKTISYQSLVGLLVEAIQEQQAQIEALNAKTSLQLKSSDEYNASIITTGATLGQNKPNPFNQQTTIDFYLPTVVGNANLYIYDLQGKQIKSMGITERGQGSIIIYANELQAGMYKYALIADGQVIGTETMILTE